MDLENRLRQIDAYCANLAHGRLLQWCSTPPLWHVDAVRGRPPQRNWGDCRPAALLSRPIGGGRYRPRASIGRVGPSKALVPPFGHRGDGWVIALAFGERNRA